MPTRLLCAARYSRRVGTSIQYKRKRILLQVPGTNGAYGATSTCARLAYKRPPSTLRELSS
eukprot:3618078-Rhodomonas_salina.10